MLNIKRKTRLNTKYFKYVAQRHEVSPEKLKPEIHYVRAIHIHIHNE